MKVLDVACRSLDAGKPIMRVTLTGRYYIAHDDFYLELPRRTIDRWIESGRICRLWFVSDNVECYIKPA